MTHKLCNFTVTEGDDEDKDYPQQDRSTKTRRQAGGG